MQRLGRVLAVLALSATVASAGGGFGVFGTYWDMEDMDDAGYGGGIRLQADISEVVGFEVRISGVTGYGGDDAEDSYTAPIEAGLTLGVPLGDAARAYIGGGAGYYVLPEYESDTAIDESEEPNIDPKDDFGYFGLVGLQFNFNESVALFVEGKYTFVEIDEVTIDDEDIDLGDDPMELTGFAVNAGLLFRF